MKSDRVISELTSNTTVTVEIEGARYDSKEDTNNFDLQFEAYPYATTRKKFKDELVKVAGVIDFSNLKCSYSDGEYEQEIFLAGNDEDDFIPCHDNDCPKKIELHRITNQNQLNWHVLLNKWNFFSKEFKDHFEINTRKQRSVLPPEYRGTENYWESNHLTQEQRRDFLQEFAFIKEQEKKFLDGMEMVADHSIHTHSVQLWQNNIISLVNQTVEELVNTCKNTERTVIPKYVLGFFHRMKSNVFPANALMRLDKFLNSDKKTINDQGSIITPSTRLTRVLLLFMCKLYKMLYKILSILLKTT